MERGRAGVTPTTPGAGRGLILPEPARSLWLEHRGAVRAMLREAGIRKYALHGGTILAARWRHRASTDIDITYGRRAVGLAALTPEDEERLRRRFPGATGVDHDEPSRTRVIRFGPEQDRRHIECSHRDTPPHSMIGATRREAVEGRIEHTKTTAAIVAGKFQRAERCVPRDLIDIDHAARADPASLEAAVNAVPDRTLQLYVWNWRNHAAHTAEEAAHDRHLRGLRNLPQGRELTERAVEAVLAARYRRLAVRRTDGGTVEIETESGLDDRPRVRRVEAPKLRRALQELGVAEYLAYNRRTAPAAVIRDIEKAGPAGGGPTTVYQWERRGRR